MEKITIKIVVITYTNGEIIAFRKDDPQLMDELIHNFEQIDILDEADFMPPMPQEHPFLKELQENE